MPSGGLTVGQAAEQTGLSPKAIRLYERKALLPTIERTKGGYRLYDAETLGVLRFIRQAKEIGLRLDEIKEVLDLQRNGRQTCGRVIGLIDGHIAEIDRLLADLRSLRGTLATARVRARADHCRQSALVCNIIEVNATTP
jgi:DNA-binding transcriptional MerR regulator